MTETLIETSKKKHKPLIPIKTEKKPRRFPWRGFDKLSQQVMAAYDQAAYNALKTEPILDWLFTGKPNKSYFSTNVEASAKALTSFEMFKAAYPGLK